MLSAVRMDAVRIGPQTAVPCAPPTACDRAVDGGHRLHFTAPPTAMAAGAHHQRRDATATQLPARRRWASAGTCPTRPRLGCWRAPERAGEGG